VEEVAEVVLETTVNVVGDLLSDKRPKRRRVGRYISMALIVGIIAVAIYIFS
jgi:hypothetical protein